MGSRNLAARESALLQQNEVLNAASSMAQEEARAALQAMANATVEVNLSPIGGAPSGGDGRESRRATSKPAVHGNSVGCPARGDAMRSSSPLGSTSERSPSTKNLEGGPPTTPSTVQQCSKQNYNSTVADAKPPGGRNDGSISSLNKSAHSLAVDQARREQAATLQHLEEQVASITESNKATERATGKMLDQIDQMKSDRVTLVRKLQQIEVQLSKQKTAQAMLEVTYKGTEAELASTHTSLDEARRHEKHAAQSSKAVQIRLDRVVADLEKVKCDLKELKEQKGGAAVPRVDFERVGKEVTTLERQTAELITLYKKQSKLIDILKRQKLHLEV
ncbi:hypothetical protein, variant 1 [Aphanomyces invadans]|uniref:Uncharacterized protein n=1 Tax=Aphanomyces invadans TaxID=157072 RepID=A0A024UMD3_9STRA|nr:hypothetical protein, variant 1 [Aphanomyces invadans]ETW07621.1 hypothetical protein, variant 1 [Aphanomyces invadans]|eukprot:XP_008863715.1 hypothetical protein, variant 1 [Aphanomyces invadans]